MSSRILARVRRQFRSAWPARRPPRCRRYREELADLGVFRVNLDRALSVAAELEDEETLSPRGEGVFGAE
ncbi:MAG: hypothetical protein F4W89_16825 [Acidobacteria bacterium]|nr:hypothetical protein [Acidobacteriota bacterium]MYJ04449.1 hypothetical protein [Acidobacteriota bacterium]